MTTKHAPIQLITGSVRSGTTLALRALAPIMTVEEESVPSNVNEPLDFTNAAKLGDIEHATAELSKNLGNRFGFVKSPHAGFILPDLNVSLTTLVVYRDLREIIPSMIEHENVVKYDLTDSYWERWCEGTPAPKYDLFARAYQFSASLYLRILEANRPIYCWEYGHWEQWESPEGSIRHLYSRKDETSASVLADIQTGRVFSDASLGVTQWDKICKDLRISDEMQERVRGQSLKIQERLRATKLLTKIAG